MIDGITWFKQSAFLFQREHNLYIDPLGITEGAPKADALFLTHAHADHFSPAAPLEGLGGSVDAAPAYNTAEERQQFHPRSNGWVGYVFTIDGVRYYHAGDTDPIPEMEAISCDVAFIPIGGYYTMDANEAIEAVKLINPQLVVPI